MEENNRNSRKSLVGTVSSKSGDKTVKVKYSYKIPHPKYKKEIRRESTFTVHDEANECAVGDQVEIMETRPLSRTKRFRLIAIKKKAAMEAALQK